MLVCCFVDLRSISPVLMQICDAVAVAGLLNATLVIPIFHLNSVWRDSRLLLVSGYAAL